MFTAIPGGVSPSVADSTLHGAHICPARTRASSPNATRPSSLFITSTNENRGTFVLLSNRKKHTQTQTHTNVSPSPCPPPSKNTHIQNAHKSGKSTPCVTSCTAKYLKGSECFSSFWFFSLSAFFPLYRQSSCHRAFFAFSQANGRGKEALNCRFKWKQVEFSFFFYLLFLALPSIFLSFPKCTSESWSEWIWFLQHSSGHSHYIHSHLLWILAFNPGFGSCFHNKLWML